jgi:hypothetical protein
VTVGVGCHDAPVHRFLDTFGGGVLDESVWTPAYLPAWSSAAQAAAAYTVEADGLHLTIPPDHPLWCPDTHRPPLRVSAVQSGNGSGPVGSTRGQQPFREGLVVREEQAPRWGFTPRYGRVEVRCRARIGPRSMFSAWMVGLEDRPERSGEICLVEVFGDAVEGDTVRFGCGIHPFRDPALREEFRAEPRVLDVAAAHTYAVEWRPGGVEFLVDGEHVWSVAQAPDYPMQLMIGLFDFPGRGPAEPVPELVVERVEGTTAQRP